MTIQGRMSTGQVLIVADRRRDDGAMSYASV